MIPRILLLLALAAPALPHVAPGRTAPGVAARETVEELWSNGTVRVRYDVDDEGRYHGSYQEFAKDGTLLLRAQYKAGVRHGAYSTFHPGGERFVYAKYRGDKLHGEYVERAPNGDLAVKAAYKEGVLDGKRTFYVERKPASVQVWKKGVLLTVDGFAPFPRPLSEIVAEQQALREATPPRVANDDPRFLAIERQRGLIRLKEYRALLGLRWEDLELDPDFDLHAQWGARLCAAIGGLDHTPANPGWEEADYRKGYRGTSHSNLATVDDAAWSIDMYMDDSDPSNIDRVGHRMHCIAGALKKTGFGCFEGYSAMWSMDRSGKAKKRDVTSFPAAGYMPVDRFGPRIAWNLSFDSGYRRVPPVEELTVEIVALDERYRPVGEPLAFDHMARLGTHTLVFRPIGIEVSPGSRYQVEITGLSGSKRGEAERMLVEFVDID